jgi:signal transduction histidine kinase
MMAALPPARLVELLDINRAIAAATDYSGLLRLVVDRTASFLDAKIAILLLAGDSDEATIAASVGLSPERVRSFRAPLDERIGAKLCQLIGCAPERFLAVPVVEGGTVRAILAVYRDATEFSAADAAMLSALADQAALAAANVRHVRRLEEALAALREADRRKDEFLAMLSHELRNPLAPIRTAIYLLTHVDPHSPSAARARNVVERQIEHLTRLVDDLLDVTRVARGKITLRREPVNVVEVARRAAEDHQALMAAHDLAFEVALPEREIWVDGDETRLVQVFGNLLQNAAKYTPAGGKVGFRVSDTGSLVEISVRDTGPGIPPDLLGRLFEPFVQGERSLARTGGGLGLGLALVKGVVELHHGTVRATNTSAGHGAEFLVTLPQSPVAAMKGVKATAPRDHHIRHRVLVIDDNRDAAESLAEVVALFGHDVQLAFDGPSAIATAHSTGPDIVLCDIGLPGRDGYEVAKAIRATHTNGVRLIAVSGYAQPDDVKKALEAGFDAHIAKPPDPEVLERLLA